MSKELSVVPPVSRAVLDFDTVINNPPPNPTVGSGIILDADKYNNNGFVVEIPNTP